MLIFLSPSEEKIPSAKPCGIEESAAFAAQAAAALSFFTPALLPAIAAYFAALKTTPEATTGAKNPAKILAAHGADLLPAIARYSGVAFAALDYPSLSLAAQTFAREHTLIFSNLFGAVLGGCALPYYKLKQGATLPQTAQPAAICAQFIAPQISAFIAAGDHAVVDLRAQFYEGFYPLKSPHARIKITKNDRVQSHFAKHYRGLIARALIEEFAQISPKNHTPSENVNSATPLTPEQNRQNAVAELALIADILRARFGASCQFCGENLAAHIDF